MRGVYELIVCIMQLIAGIQSTYVAVMQKNDLTDLALLHEEMSPISQDNLTVLGVYYRFLTRTEIVLVSRMFDFVTGLLARSNNDGFCLGLQEFQK